MPYKIMMSLAAAVPLLFSVAFLVVPHFFILESYPNAEGLAMEIGITQRYVMAGMLFMTACLAFQSRNVEKVDDQKAILLGVCYWYFCDVCCHNFIGRSRSWSSVARATSYSHGSISRP